MRWASAQSRRDKRPTDTQAKTPKSGRLSFCFSHPFSSEHCNDGTSTEEGLLKREIEDLPVVSSLSFHHAIGRDKAGVRANLRCNVASSHGGCTDGGCTVKQVGPIRMSTKHPTMLDCLRELQTRIQQDHDPKYVTISQAWQAAS